jgi:2'-5' RNA ligase
LDNKPLNFHITLGRIKKRLPDFLIREILTTELKLVDFEISEAALYRSILKPEGPIYDKIAKYVF